MRKPGSDEIVRVWNMIIAMESQIEVLKSQVYEWLPEEEKAPEPSRAEPQSLACSHPEDNRVPNTGMGGGVPSFHCLACDKTVLETEIMKVN